MKVTKNTIDETLVAYLSRVLPAFGFRVIRRSREWGPTEYFIAPRKAKFFKSINRVATIESDEDLIVLSDNDFLQVLTDILSPWESLAATDIEVKLAKEIVRA